jgi:hypothetical protein
MLILASRDNRLIEESLRLGLLPIHFALLASITMRASVIESEIAERTLGLRFCNSIDSTRASLTAAIRPATTATVPPDLTR